MNVIKQLFANVTAIKPEISNARQEAREQAERDCGRGMLVSRGAWIKSWDAKGNIIGGEAETWEWKGTAAQFKELADILRYDANVAEITIEGGWNWAVNTTAYNDCDYEPWVSEWCVAFGQKDQQPDPVEPAPAAQAAPAQAQEAAQDEPLLVTQNTVLVQFIETLERAEKEMISARREPITRAYVVVCATMALAFDLTGNVATKPTVCKPWKATRFSLRDASAVAATVKNGAGDVGEVRTLVEAIAEEIKTLRRLIGVMQGEAA